MSYNLKLTDDQVEILKKYEGLVRRHTKTWEGMEFIDDLRQQCRMALCYGIKTYRDDKNSSLTHYLSMCIESEIGKYWKVLFAKCRAGEKDEYGKNEPVLHINDLAYNGFLQGEDDADRLDFYFGADDGNIESVMSNMHTEYLLSLISRIVANSDKSEKSKNIYREYLMNAISPRYGDFCREISGKYGVTHQRVHKLVKELNEEVREGIRRNGRNLHYQKNR